MTPRKRHLFLYAGTLCMAGFLLSGCASQTSPYNRYYAANGAYKAPGTASDPWGPYIQQAANRFSIPEAWIRAVIHQESGGHQYLNGQPITSSAGAMGLMQLMPQTYAEMQSRFGLGSDPYEPHDNIMAGTGYIQILSRKYGAPAFLAAYNAGPQRLEDYLYEGRSLPNETVNYVASITPHLGTQVAMTGPLAAYASTTQLNASPMEVAEAPDTSTQLAMNQTSSSYAPPQQSVQQAWAGRRITSVPSDTMPPDLPPAVPCDPNGAYDPDTTCIQTPAPSGQLAPPSATAAPQYASSSNLPPAPVIPTPARTARASSGLTPMSVSYRTPGSYGDWGIQVGAFANPGQARFAATMARQSAFSPLQASRIEIQPTVAHGTRFWRARLAGISRSGAAQACNTLSGQGMACMAVPPGH
ncbi:lytic transglycosylase domain-containing protein [Gluconobacter frateurii]|nr:lytic transglycosylase domain-containing protein [Gluconobacter frateurii]